jgi:hypothetical protein
VCFFLIWGHLDQDWWSPGLTRLYVFFCSYSSSEHWEELHQPGIGGSQGSDNFLGDN